MILLDTKVL